MTLWTRLKFWNWAWPMVIIVLSIKDLTISQTFILLIGGLHWGDIYLLSLLNFEFKSLFGCSDYKNVSLPWVRLCSLVSWPHERFLTLQHNRNEVKISHYFEHRINSTKYQVRQVSQNIVDSIVLAICPHNLFQFTWLLIIFHVHQK